MAMSNLKKEFAIGDLFCSDKENGNYTYDNKHITTDDKIQCVNHSFSQGITNTIKSDKPKK